MIKCENECVGCPKEMGCLGDGCPNRNVKLAYCDRCCADCEELCKECLLKTFEKITLEG